MQTATVEGKDRPVRQINREIRQHIASGNLDITILNPDAQHNLGVGIVEPVTLRFAGSVGYYCAGMGDGPTIGVRGSAGWGLAEGMMDGLVVVEENAGNGAGAAIRGGIVVVKGDAGARAGVSMKGGTLLIGGDCGYMTGFMGQKGKIVVCGDAGEGLADSMYETVVYIGGEIADLGNDAVIETPASSEIEELDSLTASYGLKPRLAWQKVVSGRKLWNFSKHEATWREIQ